MRTYISNVLTVALLLAATMTISVQAQSDGPPSPEQMKQNMSRMLDNVRANPQVKDKALDRIRQRMTANGVGDVDARIAAIGKIMDAAAAMSDADFQKNQQELVSQIIAQMPGGQQRANGAGPQASSAAAGTTSAGTGGGDSTPNAGTTFPWIDVHDHLVGPNQEIAGAVTAAIAAMDQSGMTRMIVMPPPQDGIKSQGADCERFASAIRQYGPRFAFLGGGGSLNVMIQQAAGQSTVSDVVRRQFEDRANVILQMGASGFGEMAIQHLSLHGADHPYESVAADHPLFLLLADIAAKHDVPIDVHFDVVTNDISTPAWLTSPNNPKVLRANLAAFERLLDHNPNARISWAHAGSDNTGHWTADLSRRLLEKHPNLYMSLRVGPGHAVTNYPLTPDGTIKPEWLQLFKDFPSRFVIGDDEFIASSSTHATGLGVQLAGKAPASRNNTRVLLNALPPDLARKIASENATSIYKLKN